MSPVPEAGNGVSERRGTVPLNCEAIMAAEVLFVDDDRLILETSRDLFKSKGINLLTAENAEEALELFERHEIAVVVSDNWMPGMKGLELLAKLRTLSPDTVKVLISAYVDLPTALTAINNSEVYRYLLKPWKNDEIVEVVQEGLKRYHTIHDLRREDEAVLRSLAQAIELKDPSTRGHCDRVAVYALLIADAMKISKETRRQIKYGSWLHDCGKIGVPEAILNAERALTEEEFQIVMKHPEWGCEVVRKANLSKTVQEIVLYHHERYDGNGYPFGLAGDRIPLPAQVVAAADICDALTMDRPYRKGFSRKELVATMTEMKGANLDPDLVDILFQVIQEEK